MSSENKILQLLQTWMGITIVLALLFCASVFLKARWYPDRNIYASDSAMRYMYAQMASRNEPIPEVDKRIQAPEGLRVRSLLFLLEDKLIGKSHRLFLRVIPGVSFDTYLKWFVCIFSSVSVLGVYLAASSIWRSRISGLMGAAFYIVAIPSFRRIIGNYLREEVALPFIFLSFGFFLASLRNSEDQKAAHAFGIAAGVFVFLALSSWHLSGFYLLIFMIATVIALLSSDDPKAALKPALYIVGFSVLAGLVNEPLRVRVFLVSYGMIIGYCLAVVYAAHLRFKIKRKTLVALLLPLVVVSVVCAALLSPTKGEYSHVYSLVLAKAHFLLDKPADPAELPVDARLLWLGPFQSPALVSFILGFGLIAAIALYPAGFLLIQWLKEKERQEQVILLFMSVGFFLLYLAVRRLEVFAVFFIAVLIAGIYKLLKRKALVAALVVLLFCFALESHKAYALLQPTLLKNALLRIKRPEVEKPSVHDIDKTEIFRWIGDNTTDEVVFLARFPVSPMIVAYSGRSAILQPVFETKHIRRKVMECASAFYESEERLYEICKKYGADYVLYEALQLLDDGELGDRYMTNNPKVTTDCVAFKMHFAHRELRRFVLVFQTDYFRVFELRDRVSERKRHYLRYAEQFDPSLFKVDQMGEVFSDSLAAEGLKSIQKAFGLAREAHVLLDRGNYNDASRLLERALVLVPKLSGARSALAECYEKTGRYDLSVELCKKMIEEDPMNLFGYADLAKTYRRQDLFDLAIETLEKGLALIPEDRILLAELADIYSELGDSAKVAELQERIKGTGVNF